MTLSVIFKIMGGVGLFLYGMKLMSDALQDLAGDRMRELIASLTSTPVKGVLIGALVTMVIQSSSATTVMTVSFVQVGMMTLRQALGVIMGANIGTTITAQLVAFNVKELALPILGIGMVLAVFCRSRRNRYIGNGLFGFGLLFVGMSTMENAVSFLAGNKEFFLRFAAHPMLCVAAGTLLTMVVQSSSATVGLTIAMAVQGLLPLQSAVAILLGDNLGTTVTAVIASLGSNRAAKQTAAGHVLFNFIGVLIFLPLLKPFTALAAGTSSNIARQLANAHTIFNVANTLLQLPFINQLARLIQFLIPGRQTTAADRARFLDEKLLHTSPAAAVTAVRSELLEMGSMTLGMMDLVKKAFGQNDLTAPALLLQTENDLNDLTRRISAYSAKLWQHHISGALSTLLESYVNGSSDLERIGDHTQNMMELFEFLSEHRLSLSEQALSEFMQMFDHVRGMLNASLEALRTEQVSIAQQVTEIMEPQTDQMEKTFRHRHILRLNGGECSPAAGVIFADMLSNLERIGDHCTNVAEIVLARAGFSTGAETPKTFDD
ncbi:MAG: Na/Pi cotransporter family protein [Pyramidobacter sp.]|jgi:phosphate:Na+ symporter